MPDVPQTAPQPPRKKNNHGWIWFFVFVFVASIGAAAAMIMYNLSIQLTPEKLAAARELWREQGPKDYRMVYRKRILQNAEETFVSTIRGGNVTEAFMNGKPLDKDQRIYYSMDQLFRELDQFMTIDKKNSDKKDNEKKVEAMPNQPKVFVTATFDQKTGAVQHYIRSVMGKKERVEMTVKIEPLAP